MILQDFTGVPSVVDLAAMREAISGLGGDPDRINPLQPADLIIDHSVQVDVYGTSDAFAINAQREFARNQERYAFLRWGQMSFDNFSIVPPDTGIVHQVNLEYLGRVVFADNRNGELVAYPDSLVGTDSHTTMINGLGVLGWGVGGIEAEAVMLGQPISFLMPEVVGFRLSGQLSEGATGHGPRAYGDADAAAARRGGQVRRILRAGHGIAELAGSRDDLQHGAGIRRNGGHVPRGRRDAALPAPYRAR